MSDTPRNDETPPNPQAGPPSVQPDQAPSAATDATTGPTSPPEAWWTQAPVTAPGKPANGGLFQLPLFRILWAAVVALALLITWSATGPEESRDWNEAVISARDTASLNNASAQGAPQQTVVNGWHQIDLTEAQIGQNADLMEQRSQQSARLTGLLLVLGLGMAGDFALRGMSDLQASRRRAGTPHSEPAPTRT